MVDHLTTAEIDKYIYDIDAIYIMQNENLNNQYFRTLGHTFTINMRVTILLTRGRSTEMYFLTLKTLRP